MRRVVSCVICAIVLSCSVPALAAPQADSAGLRQIAGILEYVAGDYRGAVDDQGRVLHATEYEEQLSMLAEVESLGSRAGLLRDEPLVQQLAQLQQAVRERKAP